MDRKAISKVGIAVMLLFTLQASNAFAQTTGQGTMNDQGMGMGQGMMGNQGMGMGQGMMGGQGMGMGQGMMGGHGMGMMGAGARTNPECTKFYDETVEQRKKIFDMNFTYSEASRNPKTTIEQLDKISNEIIELQKKIYQKMPASCR